MLETFQATLSPMLVMFLFIVIGFICNKKGLLPENAATVLSKLENYVLVPALIINTFMRYCTVASLQQQYRSVLYCLIALVAALLISLPLSRAFAKGDYERNVYKYALTFGNFSFMGNAIVPAILGDDMLYVYMLYILPLNVAVYTWGLMILIPKGEKKGNPLKSLFNPIFISILIGAVLGLIGALEYIPSFLTSAISSCASCMGPLAMILTGFVIGGFDLKKLLTKKRIYLASALRLILLPALFIGLLLLCGADRQILLLTLFAFGTPLGLNTVVFPAAYGGDASTGASMAIISHTLCIVTIPIMYSLLTAIV